MVRLRAASYNIHHGADARDRLDLGRTAETLAALDADVIGLQEVDVHFGARSGGVDQAARLGEMLGMQVSFGAAIDRADAEGGPRHRYGNALLHRGAIEEPAMHLLEGHPSLPAMHEPRGVLRARLPIPGGPALTVLVTHLDTGHRGHRAAQVQGILRLLGELEGPAVLMGDMNNDPAASEFAALAASGWREAGAEVAGRASAGAGSRLGVLSSLLRAALPTSAARATWPARFPLRRLDAIWLHGEVRALDLRVEGSQASDHRPLVATLGLG